MGRRSTVDPAEVAHELMGTLARAVLTERGWTCQEKREMESTMKLPWHCESPGLCDGATHDTCLRQGYCEKNDMLTTRKADLARCQKVEYRQVRTVMEV